MKKIMFNDRYGLTKSVLEGKKTQTRRVISDKILDKIKLFQDEYFNASFDLLEGKDLIEAYMVNYPEKLPYNVGEIVAVAQSYSSIIEELNDPKNATCAEHYVWNQGLSRQCVGMIDHHGFRNKMFVCTDYMPHQIRITDVRVGRLQDISDEDCLKEGICPMIVGCEYYVFSFIDKEKGRFLDYKTPREAYASLIDKVSGKGTWESNPYVFVYDFELVK